MVEIFYFIICHVLLWCKIKHHPCIIRHEYYDFHHMNMFIESGSGSITKWFLRIPKHEEADFADCANCFPISQFLKCISHLSDLVKRPDVVQGQQVCNPCVSDFSLGVYLDGLSKVRVMTEGLQMNTSSSSVSLRFFWFGFQFPQISAQSSSDYLPQPLF